MGAFLAWVVERTNTPLARFIGFVLIGRIIIPGMLIVISWILIASPNIGLFNQLMRPLTGVRNVVNIYSFWGMVWVQALEMVPLPISCSRPRSRRWTRGSKRRRP